MSFGTKIQNIRKEHNLTQEELGKELFVTRAAVSKWERDLSLPSEETLDRICSLYNISLDDLLEKKDILRNSNTIKRNSKWILLFSIIGGTILLSIIILLMILLLTKKEDIYSEYYACMTGIDETYLYADTRDGEVRIPKDCIVYIKENEEEIRYSDLKLHDYGRVERRNNQFYITITDHELDGWIAKENTCGFLLSFQDELPTSFNPNEISNVPFFYNNAYSYNDSNYNSSIYYSSSNINGILWENQRELSFTLDSLNFDVINGNINLYEIYIDNSELKLRFYKKLNLNSSTTYSIVKKNLEYDSSSLYSESISFIFSFHTKNYKEITLYQYDENMNLLNTVSLEGNYLDNFSARDSILSNVFMNVIDTDTKIAISKDAKNDENYLEYMPYTSGFYYWN